MHRFPKLLLALTLFSTSVISFGQDISSAINRLDYPDSRLSNDQYSATTGDAPLSPSDTKGGRVRITNQNGQTTDVNGNLRNSSGKDGQQRQGLFDNTWREPPESSFQKFVQASIGKKLPIFGFELFSNRPTSFAPVLNSPVQAEYPMGPGDEILIHGWGSIDIDYRATVDRNGQITIPSIGTVMLGGVPAGQAESVIQGAVGKLFKGVNISVTFGRLRSITVYVVGHAARPGTYAVSSMSTLVTAIFASGGPGTNGSMRQIQVKRGGTVAAEIDLYDFIAKGDKHADIKLQDGDTIYFPSAAGYVAITGEVNNPAIFELRTTNETIENFLELAGGVSVLADSRRAFLERIEQEKNQPRMVDEVTLDSAGVKQVLKNGDLLNIEPITPEFSNAVVLRGHVKQAIRAPYKAGMHVSDLIPSRDFLISRSSVYRQNNTLNEWQADQKEELRAIRRAETRSGNGTRDPNGSVEDTQNDGNKTGDLSQDSYRDSSRNSSTDKTGDGGARDAAGDQAGKTEDSTSTSTSTSMSNSIASRIGSLVDEINWDYAVIERVNRIDLSTSLISFNLGDAFEHPAGPNNVILQPGDTVTVFSQNDVLVPLEKRRIFVRVEGEVNLPGVYQMNQGDNLIALIARAGGPTRNAYLFGTSFFRDQVRTEQEVNLEKAIDRLESRMLSEQAKSAANTSSAVDAQTAELQRQAALAAAKETIARMRKLQPTGRISFGLDPTEISFNKLPELKLQNGDRLVIPSRPDFVHVFGSVNSESSQLWRQGEPANRYLKGAGLSSEADVENIFILRADGSVVSRDTGSWLTHGTDSVVMMPGDSIVVPEILDKQTSYTRFMIGLKDWTQVIANFGIGIAAIHVLKE